jgi:hypothetical protein
VRPEPHQAIFPCRFSVLVVLVEIARHGEGGVDFPCPMATLCTDLLANQARLLADMIETLPVSLAPIDQHARCQELIDQLERALAQLPAAALG